MRILILINLYPPHHAATHDYRCQTVAHLLRKRGHDVQVLTSKHGVRAETRDDEAHRRLILNGVYGHPAVTAFNELKELEIHNNSALSETIESAQPELIFVWSLHGLSKSIIFFLRNLRLPTVYDVSDLWMADELRTDPWLQWWNVPKLPFTANAMRSTLELSGQRDKLDEIAPTRDRRENKRLSNIFEPGSVVEPNSITNFHFTRAYFCNAKLRELASAAGINVSQTAVIYSGIDTANFEGDVKPADKPIRKVLMVSRFEADTGLMTAMEALQKVRETDRSISLNVYGRGDSDLVAKLKSHAIRFELPVEFQNVSDPVRDLPNVYKQHDLFINAAEGKAPLPPQVLEAMAAGLPVVNSMAGGASEILRHGENALLFETGNASSLADNVKALLVHSEFRQQMASAGQTEVLNRYTYEEHVNQIEAYLQQSLEYKTAGLE